jgi:hypothetical protein
MRRPKPRGNDREDSVGCGEAWVRSEALFSIGGRTRVCPAAESIPGVGSQGASSVLTRTALMCARRGTARLRARDMSGRSSWRGPLCNRARGFRQASGNLAILGYGSIMNMTRCAVRRRGLRFRGISEKWPDSGRNQWPGSIGLGDRRALESVVGMDRNTQPPTRIDPQLSRQQSGTLHRQTARVRGSMTTSFGVSVRITPEKSGYISPC